MITIIAKHPAWGAADNFYRAFRSCNYETTLLCLGIDKYNRSNGEKIVTKITKDNLNYFLKNSKVILVCSPVTLSSIIKKIDRDVLKKLKNIDNKIIFITGTDYIKNYKYWNKVLKNLNFRVRFCEAEMIKFDPENNKFLSHPMEYYNISKVKNEIITISHAPGIIERPEKKGTKIILSVINKLKEKYEFVYDHIIGVSLIECLERKAKSHIFIDQINPEVGGIGKNGYEGLALNCITMASVNSFKDIKDNVPPVINVNSEKELYQELENLLLNKEKIFEKINETSIWKENINYKNTIGKFKKWL